MPYYDEILMIRLQLGRWRQPPPHPRMLDDVLVRLPVRRYMPVTATWRRLLRLVRA